MFKYITHRYFKAIVLRLFGRRNNVWISVWWLNTPDTTASGNVSIIKGKCICNFVLGIFIKMQPFHLCQIDFSVKQRYDIMSKFYKFVL